MISVIIETLRLLDSFLPRITFGKVAAAPLQMNDGQSVLTKAPPEWPKPESESDPKGFLYLKRDLVRLLGVLVSGRTLVQDRVRHCSGIPVVLTLCVVDERNPCEYHDFSSSCATYLREKSSAIIIFGFNAKADMINIF